MKEKGIINKLVERAKKLKDLEIAKEMDILKKREKNENNSEQINNTRQND